MKKNEKIEQKTSKPKMKWFSWMALLRIVVGLNLILTAGIVMFAIIFLDSYSFQTGHYSDNWFKVWQEFDVLKSRVECLEKGSNPESEECLKATINENVRICFDDKIMAEYKVEECKKYNEANEKYTELLNSQIQSDE